MATPISRTVARAYLDRIPKRARNRLQLGWRSWSEEYSEAHRVAGGQAGRFVAIFLFGALAMFASCAVAAWSWPFAVLSGGACLALMVWAAIEVNRATMPIYLTAISTNGRLHHCPDCNYDLQGTSTDHCTECGCPVVLEDSRSLELREYER